ncbi:MAG: ABC transporter permease [Calditrichaeota bacterium]|nr:ABC transporter permease [Calditrichota bacterium]
MIRHFIKLLWNKKRANSLMIAEIFLSFIVLFAIVSTLLTNVINYNTDIGYNAENIWIIKIDRNKRNEEDAGQRILRLKTELKLLPEVLNASAVNWAMIFLGSGTNSNTYFTYNDIVLLPHPFRADDDYADLMQLTLTEGRWFSEEDNAADIKPVIINEKLKHDMFGDEAAAGRTVLQEKNSMRIIGVVKTYKGHGEFSKPEQVIFNRVKLKGQMYDTDIYIRVAAGSGARLEKKIMEKLSSLEKDWSYNIRSSEEIHSAYLLQTFVPLFILAIIAGFLILNVVLGLFGALWYSINQRKSEIGLRRAKGAIAKQIYQQFILEMFILAGFAVLLGIFLVIQIPILNVFPDVEWSTYLIAILSSTLIIYLLIFICAIYPSRQAMQIQPALALHDE